MLHVRKINISFPLLLISKNNIDLPESFVLFYVFFLQVLKVSFISLDEYSLIGRSKGIGGLYTLWIKKETIMSKNMQKKRKRCITYLLLVLVCIHFTTWLNMDSWIATPTTSLLHKFLDLCLLFTRHCRLLTWN